MSQSHQGIVQGKEWVNKRVAEAGSEEAKKYGRPKTEEEKMILSIESPKFWLGKNRDEETKRKISETKKEKGLSDKQKELLYKKVYKYNITTNQIFEIFESTGEAAKKINVNQSTISRWCQNNKIIDNYLWTYIKK
jgi:NUMOD1 domain